LLDYIQTSSVFFLDSNDLIPWASRENVSENALDHGSTLKNLLIEAPILEMGMGTFDSRSHIFDASNVECLTSLPAKNLALEMVAHSQVAIASTLHNV
jgi:hypothetical protein